MKEIEKPTIKRRDFQEKQIKAFCAYDTSIAKIVLLTFCKKYFCNIVYKSHSKFLAEIQLRNSFDDRTISHK